MGFWDDLVERRIEEALDRGELNAEAYHGKQLAWDENPYVPEAQRLAFKLLKDNDLVPAWIMDGKEIREAIDRAVQDADQAYAAFRRTLRQLQGRIDVAAIYEREVAYHAWDADRAQFLAAVDRINRLINTYNLRVPISDLQRLYFNGERVLERLESASRDLGFG